MRRQYLLFQIVLLILFVSCFLLRCNKAKKSNKDGELSNKPLEISDCKNQTTVSTKPLWDGRRDNGSQHVAYPRGGQPIKIGQRFKPGCQNSQQTHQCLRCSDGWL